MEITNINVRKINQHDKMKAVVSVTFDDLLVVHDIKVIAGAERTFIAMPSRKTNDGRFADIVHPINQELRQRLETEVLAAYEIALEEELSKEEE